MKTLSKQTKIIAIVALVIGIVAAILTLEAQKYNNREKATVTATVTAMEDYVDTGDEFNEQGYEIFVDYEYAGKPYRHVSYKKVSAATDVKTGDTFDVEIYVSNPAAIAQDTKNFAIYVWLLFGAGVVFTAIRVANDVRNANREEPRETETREDS